MTAASEIPILRESITYAARLIDAARSFGDPRYHFHRRVNWSYRYAERFYEDEVECFEESPEAYLAGRTRRPAQLADVYRQRLSAQQVMVVVMKAFAHWLFLLLGRQADRRLQAAGVHTYRKCYVDDIELVFDPNEAGVIRAVYPFPINVRRQLRYLAYLRRRKLDFKLAGNPYLPADVLRFVVRRDVRSLLRMESRAQILHAGQVARLGVRTVQLSDEFDMGSLDFTKRLSRLRVWVVNSAHGAGKYLPMHAYPEFHTLTEKQQRYYHPTRPCTYTMRRLNERLPEHPVVASIGYVNRGVSFVFLSQLFVGLCDAVHENEEVVTARLRDAFGDDDRVRLLYKPHPNRNGHDVPAGFSRLDDLAAVNGRPGTVFGSFFSTCQIDPTFKGRKVLIRGRRIYPEMAFDDCEPIVDVNELIELLSSLAHRLSDEGTPVPTGIFAVDTPVDGGKGDR